MKRSALQDTSFSVCFCHPLIVLKLKYPAFRAMFYERLLAAVFYHLKSKYLLSSYKSISIHYQCLFQNYPNFKINYLSLYQKSLGHIVMAIVKNIEIIIIINAPFFNFSFLYSKKFFICFQNT